jgi:hypothetical protein
LLLENVREPPLGQTTMQGHLTTLETDFCRIAGTRLLALLSPSGGLTETRARTAAKALLPMRRTLCGMQIIKTKCHSSLQKSFSIYHFRFVIGSYQSQIRTKATSANDQ